MSPGGWSVSSPDTVSVTAMAPHRWSPIVAIFPSSNSSATSLFRRLLPLTISRPEMPHRALHMHCVHCVQSAPCIGRQHLTTDQGSAHRDWRQQRYGRRQTSALAPIEIRRLHRALRPCRNPRHCELQGMRAEYRRHRRRQNQPQQSRQPRQPRRTDDKYSAEVI